MQDQNKFLELVVGLQSSAWALLGKTSSPHDGQVHRSLPEVRRTIDILQALQEKTEGNLTPEEDKVLKNSLRELQLNYVKEMNKERQKEENQENSQDNNS